MQEIAGAVREGANAFLIEGVHGHRARRGASSPSLIYVFIDIPLDTGGAMAVGFVLGAGLSAFAGYVGMAITVRTSSRTAQAAKNGLGHALTVCLQGRGRHGDGGRRVRSPRALALLHRVPGDHHLEPCYAWRGSGFGASLIAMFMRVSGGIYTKAADVGADLVGKVEANIPEDDPRNPAVIADNVGDNVGDCAGMGADVYESFVVTADRGDDTRRAHRARPQG